MSQQQRRRVAISSGSIPVIPDYGNTFDMLTSEFNFMDDIRFKPLDVLLENYGTLINEYESEEWDSVYRQNKEIYSKMESEDLLAKVQRRHFPYRNEVIVVNPKYSYTTAFTKLPDYPVSLTSFNSGSPLIIKKFKVRLPITEAAVTLGMNYIEDFYPSEIIDSGETLENPTVSQFYEDMKHRDEYLKSQSESMVSIQKAASPHGEAFELSVDPYPGYVRSFTNEDYYKSLWSSRETGDFMYKVYDDNKNSIIPSDVLPGITDIHYLSYINRLSQIFGVNYSGEPSMIGNPGDIISYEFLENETKQYKNYAWDPQNNEWSAEFFDNFISPVLSRQMDNLISKMKAKNEFLIGLRPFMMAANYLPSFKINRDLIGSTTTTTTTTTEEPTTTTTTTEEPTTTTTTTEEPTTTTTTTEEPTTTTTTTQSSGYYSYDFTSKVQRVLNGDNSLGDILAKRGVTDWDGTQRFVASDLNIGTQVYYIGTDGNKHFITFDTSISNDGVTNQQTGQPYNYLEIIDGVITGIFGDGVTFDSITPFN